MVAKKTDTKMAKKADTKKHAPKKTAEKQSTKKAANSNKKLVCVFDGIYEGIMTYHDDKDNIMLSETIAEDDSAVVRMYIDKSHKIRMQIMVREDKCCTK